MSYAEAYFVSSIISKELKQIEERLNDMSSGEKFEQLVKDIVAKHETAYRNPDVKDVYNMMSMIGAEADKNAEFKTDVQNFIKSIIEK